MKRNLKRFLTLLLALAIMVNSAAVMPAFAIESDGTVKIVEHIREVDFSQFTDSDFSADTDTTVTLAEGIKFITSGSSNEKPKIETGTWQNPEGKAYTNRLNTGGGGRWTADFSELRRAIIIEDVKVGDKIEIVYGSSSLNRSMNELIGIDGSGYNGTTVLTATTTHTPFKYTVTASENGTYFYHDPQGTYHIYAVKVTSFTYEEVSASYEYVREVDFSKFTDSDFSSDTDTTIVLAEGIKFITSGSSNEKPKIETGTWQSAEAGAYSHRLNTGGGGRWTNDNSGLRRAIIIEDVEVGDKIEIVYGSSSKNRTMNELVGVDGSGNNGTAVLTATTAHTPFKYTLTAEEAGTYYYYDPQGTYHIYGVKVTSYESPQEPQKPDFIAYGSSLSDAEKSIITLEWYPEESDGKYYIYELTGKKTLLAELNGETEYEFQTDGNKSEYVFVVETSIDGKTLVSNQVILTANESGSYTMTFTDSDEDTLPDMYELIIGTDINNPDTDEDELPDGYEVYTLGTDPIKPDTDDDGTGDGDEDFDNDGLTNSEEYQFGTGPWNKDSDGDELSDGDEVNIYGTDPLLPDTDGDGISDYTEILQGLNPLETDSDGNGITDGSEILEHTITTDNNEEYLATPTVELAGEGDLRTAVKIEEISDNIAVSDLPFIVGEPFDFMHGDDLSFESSTLSFTLNNSILATYNIEDLAIAHYNTDNGTLKILNTNIISENTISAAVEHYSVYLVVDKNKFIMSIKTSVNYNKITINEKYKTVSGEYNGHFYAFIDNLQLNGCTWAEAEAFCREMGGHLATITSAGEQAYITNLIKSGTKPYYWIGGKKVNNAWTWITGEPFAYSNWAAGEPNNTNGREESIHLYNPQGTWNDENGASANSATIRNGVGLLCEWDEYINEADVREIFLSNGTRIMLFEDPKLGNRTIDSDEDGVPDLDELIEEVDMQFDEDGEVYKAWTFNSNPTREDSDGDWWSDYVDPNPLNSVEKNGIVVYQSDRLPGKNVDGSISSDMLYGDLLHFETAKYVPQIFGNTYYPSTNTAEREFRNLANLASTDNHSMEIVVNELVDKFIEGSGGYYSNNILIDNVKNHPSTQAYISDSKAVIFSWLKEGKTFLIDTVNDNTTTVDCINNRIFDKTSRPMYNLENDNFSGLGFAMHDTWGRSITIKEISCDGKNYSITLEYHLYDNFGLDISDVTGGSDKFANLLPTLQINGFQYWFYLQHCIDYKNKPKYKPFITSVKFTENISGTM